MEFLYFPLTCFIAGVGLSALFFLTRRKEPANTPPDQQLTQQLLSLSARISALEKSKMGKVELIELTEAVKQIMKDHEAMKKLMSDNALEFNHTVMRLISTFKPYAKKEISQ